MGIHLPAAIDQDMWRHLAGSFFWRKYKEVAGPDSWQAFSHERPAVSKGSLDIHHVRMLDFPLVAVSCPLHAFQCCHEDDHLLTTCASAAWHRLIALRRLVLLVSGTIPALRAKCALQVGYAHNNEPCEVMSAINSDLMQASSRSIRRLEHSCSIVLTGTNKKIC